MKILPFAAIWMDLEIIILSEVSQAEKDKYISHHLICGSLKNIIQVNLFYKTEQTHRNRKQTYSFQKGQGKGRDKLGLWD